MENRPRDTLTARNPQHLPSTERGGTESTTTLEMGRLRPTRVGQGADVGRNGRGDELKWGPAQRTEVLPLPDGGYAGKYNSCGHKRKRALGVTATLCDGRSRAHVKDP